MCARALSSLLSHANDTRNLTGAPTSKKGPCLNLLFFVDDSCFSVRQTLYIGAN